MAPGAAPTVSWRRGLSVSLLAAAGLMLWRAQLGAVTAFAQTEQSPVRDAGKALRAAAAAPAPDDRAVDDRAADGRAADDRAADDRTADDPDDRAADDRAARARPHGWARRVALPGHLVLEPAAGDASPALMLVDLVLVPKHGHIFASALPSTLFEERTHPSTLARWAGPGPWERLARVCAALPALELAVGSRVLRSGPCVPLDPLDPNLGALSLARFPLSAETCEALRAELAANGPRAQVAVRLTAGGLYATIDPVSRAAGLFRGVRRPLTGREDEDLGRAAAWADPLGPPGANPPEQLSVCMKHILDSNLFMEDVVAHHEAQGVAHLYLSVVGPEIEREMAERLARWIAAGFLTLVQLDGLARFVELAVRPQASLLERLGLAVAPPAPQPSRFWKDQVKMFYINSCLHHAKQLDALVGAWDIDELASIHEPGWSDPHLARYVLRRYARWAPAAGHVWRPARPALTPPAPDTDLVRVANALLGEPRANVSEQAVMPLLWYCEVSLGRFSNHGPVSSCAWSRPGDGKLAGAYPFRSQLPGPAPKGIAITANVQLLELHQHNFNCERNELERMGNGTDEVRVVRQRPPFSGEPFKQRRRSIFSPAPALFIHHFTDLYG